MVAVEGSLFYDAGMQSKAKTVPEYLDSLPADRRAEIEKVRAVILKNLSRGFEERMQYGMIGYCVPHSIYPAGYHCKPEEPLPFAGLASQKNAMSVYLMSLYMNPPEEKLLRDGWARTGKKLDMGKSCIRFKKVDDLALDVLGEAFKRVTVKGYVERYEQNLSSMGKGSAAKAAKRKGTPKKGSKKVTKKTAKR